jgi:hypothetical protein
MIPNVRFSPMFGIISDGDAIAIDVGTLWVFAF